MRILIVDDHPLIVEGIGAALGEMGESVELLSARDAAGALELYRLSAPFALVLADVFLPDADGMDLIRQLRGIHSEVPVVVLSANDSKESVLRALNAGAMGFISKLSPTAVLIGAIKLVLSGGVYIPPQVLVATPDRSSESARPARGLGLTERQTEVLTLLMEGKPNKLICRELNVSEGTVKTHVSAILRALNVSNRAQVPHAISKMGLPLPSRGGATFSNEGSALRSPFAQHE